MEVKAGRITHYYNRIGVAVVEVLDAPLKLGDTIRIEGRRTDLTQMITSMQIEHKNIEEAKRGETIGLKVVDRVMEGDLVFKVMEE